MDEARIRRALREDLERLRAPEGYLRAGAPRYGTLFGRDSLIAAWQTLRVDPAIAEATLRVLARFQGKRVHAASEEEPGKILHEDRGSAEARAEIPFWEFPYYGSVDSTPLFLIVADAYLSATDDARLLDDLWGPCTAAYHWMIDFGDADGDGFLEYERKNPRGLFHQGWKDGSEDHLRIAPPVAMVEVQGYAIAAYSAYASLARRRGETSIARDAQSRSERLRHSVDRTFWMEKPGFFALALDGAKRLRTAITSNPGHLLALGVVDPAKVPRVIPRFFEDDLWTPFGVRTHATSEPDFDPYGYHLGTVWPHDNWFLYRGLRASGREEEAGRVRDALLRAHEALGRIPELYAVDGARLVDLSAGPGRGTRANPLQAWASAGLLDILTDG